ncbi:MAG: hypothetical protein LUF90_09480 [Rikenellaceae bacterium]|nr:hypothetical protein [Rikenellaceae bacterium]
MKKTILLTYPSKFIAHLQGFDYCLKINDPRKLTEINFLCSNGELSPLKILVFIENEEELIECNKYSDLPLIIFLSKCQNIIDNISVPVFLNSEHKENFDACKKWNKEGGKARCGMYVKPGTKIRWDLLEDLRLFGLNNQLNIEPFQHLTNVNFKRQMPHLQALYLNDPSHYMHVNEEGYYAFSLEAMEKKEYVGNLTDDTLVEIDKKWKKYMLEEYNYFLKDHECASCVSWRICRGLYGKGKNCECSELFISLIAEKNNLISKTEHNG